MTHEVTYQTNTYSPLFVTRTYPNEVSFNEALAEIIGYAAEHTLWLEPGSFAPYGGPGPTTHCITLMAANATPADHRVLADAPWGTSLDCTLTPGILNRMLMRSLGVAGSDAGEKHLLGVVGSGKSERVDLGTVRQPRQRKSAAASKRHSTRTTGKKRRRNRKR